MKKSFFIIGLMFAASVLRAEVLTWSVDLVAGNGSYETAQLFSAESNTGNFYDSVSNIGGPINKDSGAGYVIEYDSDVTAGTAYFFVKLSNGSYSDAMSWSQLVSAGSLVSGNTPDASALTPWNITSVTVPEPTSMALLAMGVSALLLRRKRVA